MKQVEPPLVSSTLPAWAHDDYTPERIKSVPFNSEKKNGLLIFRVVEICTMLTAALYAGNCCCILFFVSINSSKEMLMRFFGILFSSLSVFVELNLLRSELGIFENWIFRGVFYIYVGCQNDKIDAGMTNFMRILSVSDASISSVMTVFGAAYFCMGLTCRKEIKELLLIEHQLLNELPDEFSLSQHN